MTRHPDDSDIRPWVSIGEAASSVLLGSAMIVAAAVRVEGLIISLPRPVRHPDIMRALWNINRKLASVPPRDQGFLTSAGEFMTREEAAMLLGRDKPVFSEDLW